MEKIYFKMKEPLSKGLLLLLLLFVGMTANATDFTEVELGTGYEIKSCTNWYGKWTATSDGKLYCKESRNADNIAVYSDEALTSKVTETALNGTKSLELDVTSGTTYYFKTAGNNLGASVITFTFEGKGQETISLESVSPTDGSTLDVTGSGKVSLKFDRAIKIENATIASGTNSASLTVNVTNSYYAGCDFKSILFDWLQSGAVKQGDDVTITFNNVTMADDSNVKYGTDGTLTLNYKAPKAPVSLVSITKPEAFKSVWTAGDEDGKVVFTFTDEISSAADDAPVAYISYGNLDKNSEGRYYYETITPTISGKTVTFDLTGKDRSSNMSSVVSGLTDTEKAESYYTKWNVILKGVKDTEGNFVYSDAQGSIGSFSTVIPLAETTENAEVTTEFTPVSGSSLANVDNIEIYISPAAAISSYTGVKFDYVKSDDSTADTVVEKANITETTEDGDLTLTVPVPAEAKTATDVKVTIDGLTFASGYTGDITATYNPYVEFSVELIKPETTSLASINSGDSIKVKPTHFEEIGYMRYSIYDAESGDCIKSDAENMVKNADGTVSYEVFGDYTLYEGHTYNLIFDAWPSEADKRKSQNHIGTDTLKLTGLSEEFKFSTVKFVSIDPAESDDYVIDSEDKNVFTVTFDGLVTLDEKITALGAESGTSVAFESITAMDEKPDTIDGKVYSKVWKLVAPVSFLKESPTTVGLSVKAYDEDGKLVEGNTGELAQSYLGFSYYCSLGSPDYTITPKSANANDPQVLDKLYTFVAEYSGGICTSGNVALKNAVLKSYDSTTKTYTEEVAHVVKAEQIIPDDADYSYQPTQVRLVLDKAIVNEGTVTVKYQLYIPYMYFNLGSDMTAANSKAMTVNYTLVPNNKFGEALKLDTASVAPVPVEVDATSTVESLKEISFAVKPISASANISAILLPQGSSVVDVPVMAKNTETGEEYFGTLEEVEISTDGKTYKATFENEITTKGTYTVTIPKGAILLDQRSSFADIVLTYNVAPAIDVVTISPDSSSVNAVTSLKEFVLTWPEETLVNDNGGTITLYSAADRSVVTTATTSWGDADNQLKVTLKDEITAAGNYTLVIPAGAVSLGEDYRDCAEHSFFYFIEEDAAEEEVTSDPADGATVTSLSTITLTWPNETTVGLTYNTEVGDAVLKDANGNTYEIKVDLGEAWNTIVVTLTDEITAAGTYTLSIPAGYVNLGEWGDREAAAHTFTYIIGTTGINGIAADAQGRYTVYNVAGMRIKSADNAAALKNLKPGLYIINGKKVAVK